MEKEEEKKISSKLTIHKIFWYFIIFSIVGLLIETFYCYITTGILESRKGLLWGPFCPVYGIGATILILFLHSYKEHPFKLFFYGAFVGAIVEFILSFMLEAVYGTRFWEYSYLPFNINGRICITYSIFWGILGLVLILFIEPAIDHFLSKLPIKVQLLLEKLLLIFLIIDVIATVIGISLYKQKAMGLYYGDDYSPKGSITSWMTNTIFSDQKLEQTFPNLRFIDKQGKEIWIKDIL